MGVRRAGRRRAGDPWRSVNSTKSAPSAHQTYSYGSPKMTLECEKLSKEELEKLSGEVVTYKLEELEGKK
ncbi:hypothetical protein CN984_12640 [Bacillus cereus]|uniref:Uncharacterized protein n=1 Tax=Bacillus cereus TaxID=1396 RepID=A0A2A7FNY1_BACCE|nr:hypothetical protein [Bacillus cereus]PEA25893.1 hypothetical protein CON44_18315 [Bacillus cereus]PGO29265.1 hypothetical protein CN984_12640 [Bacillus cereus]